MITKRKIGTAVMLLGILAMLAGCGGSGGGSSSDAQPTKLEDVAVPEGFDFSNTKAVDVVIHAAEHGLSENAYVKLTLDPQHVVTIYLGVLNADGGLSMRVIVPAKTTRLYYKVYEPDTQPFEGELLL